MDAGCLVLELREQGCVHLVCEPGRLGSFHPDVACPSQHGDQCREAPGVSAKATEGREGTSERGMGGSGLRPSASTSHSFQAAFGLNGGVASLWVRTVCPVLC